MCKCKLAITLSEEIMIVGRKKDGDGKGNKWNEVNMEILEVSLYSGIVGGKLSCHVSNCVTHEHMWRMNTFGIWTLCGAWTVCHVWYMSRVTPQKFD